MLLDRGDSLYLTERLLELLVPSSLHSQAIWAVGLRLQCEQFTNLRS